MVTVISSVPEYPPLTFAQDHARWVVDSWGNLDQHLHDRGGSNMLWPDAIR